MDVSQSKIKTWRQCRKQYYYKYILKITKKFKPYPLLRGSVVHDMLESHYKGKDPWVSYKKFIKENEKIIRLNPEEYGNLTGDMKNVMEGYFDYYEDEDLTPIKVEHEFRTKLIGNIYLTGKIDLIAKSQKLNWLTEHKCHNTIPTGMVPYSNMQSSLYIWAWNKEQTKKLDGILWNYILGKPAPVPQLLKNGKMSRRKSTTTWAIYKSQLIKHKIDPKNYSSVKKDLAGNEALYYQRKFIPLNKTLMMNVVDDTKVTAQEIARLGGKDQTRNLGHHCDFCEYKNLCLAQIKGLDDNYILKSDFMKREKQK